MTMKKRLLSSLLILCILLTMLPATAAAEGESATAQGSAATFTLSASSASCADRHTGELGSIQITDVDISRWGSDKKITLKYDVQYRCTDPSCELYSSDDSFFSYSGTHTITDTNTEFCHKKISESFAATIPAVLPSGGTKDFSISFALTSDKGIYESLLHEQNIDLCTKHYYSLRCWECTGCGYFFLNADMSGDKITKDNVYFPPVGHNLKNVPAKDPTCVAKGIVEHWHCERCTRNFGDEQGTSELTTIETDAPLAAHRYDADGACEVCSRKAAAGVQANAGMVWYDTMSEALTALTDGAQLAINADYADTITLNQTCTVEVKAGVTVADIQIETAENCVVTIVNNGSVSNLSGYTGKLVLKSGGGSYGSIANRSEGGTVGALLYTDNAAKFCYYKKGSVWLHPNEATDSSIQNVTVAYAPLATLTITGGNVTGGDGSYALTANKDDTLTLTAAAFDLDGESTTASYRWTYKNDPDTVLSTASTLTLETVSAGKRTIVCMATVDGYSITAKLVLTVGGQKDAQSFTLKIAKAAVGIREKVLPFLSVEGVQEEAAVTYYQMLGETPAPETDTEIGADFTFTTPGSYQLYAYTAETDNYAATVSAPMSITVTPHANHCICGGTLGHTHENVQWQAWDGKSAIEYEQKWVQVSEYTKQGRYVAYVYLTGNVSANLTVAPKHILYLCLNGYSFTCADPSQPAITLTGEDGKPVELDLCDCVGTGTLGGSNASGGSIRIGAYANATLYSGTLTGNNVSGDGGAVSVTGGNCSFTMYGGAITGNTATGNGGGISSYDSWNAGTVNINGGVISNNRATNGGGIYAASRTHFHLNGGEIINNTATGDGGGVYCRGLYSNADGRCEFYGGTISGNTAKQGGGAYVRACYIGYRNCRITDNTATEAGGGLYLVPFASEKRIYMGSVYGSSAAIAPYIYDNTVNSAQNNLYLSDPDTQIEFSAHMNTDGGAKIGVYFTGITSSGASVLLSPLQINSESRAKLYLDRIFCDNPDYGKLEIQQDDEYYNLYLINAGDEVTITFDPNGGTLNVDDETKTVQHNGTYGEMPTPIRSGYHFDGWYTEKGGGTKVDANTSVTTKEAHTLYAHWTFLHEHCICGGDVTAGDHTSHSDVTYQKWDGKSSSISYTNNVAHVYLTENAQISDNIFVQNGKTLYLCLNGKEYAKPSDVSTQRKFIVTGGGHLILCDCVGTGSINCGKSDGGGGCVYLNSSTMDMYGGKFTGSSAALGGAIAVVHSTLNLYGGEISGNTASEKGGAVYVESGTVNISGKPVVKDNNVSSQPNNIYLPTGKAVSITGSMTDGAEVGITTESTAYPVVFSNAWTTDYSKYFFADSANAHVEYNGDEQLQLAAGAPVMHTHNWATGWSSNSTHHWHECTAEGCTITDNSQKDGYAEHSGTDDNNCTTAVTCECGYEIKAAKAEHNWSVWSHNTTTHTHSCQNEGCGTTETKDCTGGTATCTAQAVCEVCGGAYGELAAHSFTEETAAEQYLKSAATCTKKAVYYKSCAVCGLSSKGTADEATFFSGNVLDHDWGAWTQNSDEKTHTRTCKRDESHTETGNCTGGTATCTAKAVCTVCGGAYGEMNAHDFTAETAAEQYLKSAATCTEKAVYYKSCTACGLSSKGTTDEATFTSGNILGHDWGAWTSNGNDTHTRVCSRDASHTETDNCSGGTATCTAKAVCTICGGAYGEMNAHDFTAETAAEQYLKSAATCTEKAVYYKSCTACGLSSKGTTDEATFTSGNILGHDWGAWTQNSDEKTHTRICKRDTSHTETENCHGGTASCTMKAVCEVCGGEYSEMAAHSFTTEKAETQYLKSAATCTEKAIYYKSCAVCGLSSKGTTDEATFTSGNILGHDWGAWTQNSDEKTHTRICKRDTSHTETENCHGGTATCTAKAVCEVCKAEYGEKDPEHHAEGCELEWVVTETEHEQKYSLCGKVTIAKEKHTFGDWTIIQRPTSNRDGEKERICQICQYKETKTIPATGSNYSYYTIKATAGAGGSISPSGNVSVREGRDQTFTITPDKGYAVANVKIDGRSIGAVKSYIFENVKRAHTIEVSFTRANEFIDVPSDSYFYKAVMWAVENGITTGASASRFDPNGVCTRAQAVAFLWRAAGSPEPKTNTMPFTDVNAGSYYYDAVLWAVENGITKGTSDTTFSPNMTCSRAQIVAFLWRSEKSPAAGTANPFADVKSTAYYAGAVLWAVREDITKGTTSTTFSPDADCTRAQIVTFLWRCKK